MLWRSYSFLTAVKLAFTALGHGEPAAISSDKHAGGRKRWRAATSPIPSWRA